MEPVVYWTFSTILQVISAVLCFVCELHSRKTSSQLPQRKRIYQGLSWHCPLLYELYKPPIVGVCHEKYDGIYCFSARVSSRGCWVLHTGCFLPHKEPTFMKNLLLNRRGTPIFFSRITRVAFRIWGLLLFGIAGWLRAAYRPPLCCLSIGFGFHRRLPLGSTVRHYQSFQMDIIPWTRYRHRPIHTPTACDASLGAGRTLQR